MRSAPQLDSVVELVNLNPFRFLIVPTLLIVQVQCFLAYQLESSVEHLGELVHGSRFSVDGMPQPRTLHLKSDTKPCFWLGSLALESEVREFRSKVQGHGLMSARSCARSFRAPFPKDDSPALPTSCLEVDLRIRWLLILGWGTLVWSPLCSESDLFSCTH